MQAIERMDWQSGLQLHFKSISTQEPRKSRVDKKKEGYQNFMKGCYERLKAALSENCTAEPPEDTTPTLELYEKSNHGLTLAL